MSDDIKTSNTGATRATVSTPANLRILLTCGVIAGPLFVGVVALQALTRDGFDLSRHPISLLSLGDLGWIQITNFVVAGLLSIAFAVGMWLLLHPSRAGTWGPILMGVFGTGLVAGGAFVTDPSLAFPPGAPEGALADYSWHATVHNVAPGISLDAIIIVCLVFVRRFAALRHWGWVTYSAGTAATVLLLSWWPDEGGISVRLALAVVFAFMWVTALAVRLRAELSELPISKGDSSD
jgi:Protein of unknown function (DUF998)